MPRPDVTVKEEYDPGQEQQMVVAGDHMLGTEVKKGPICIPPPQDIAAVAAAPHACAKAAPALVSASTAAAISISVPCHPLARLRALRPQVKDGNGNVTCSLLQGPPVSFPRPRGGWSACQILSARIGRTTTAELPRLRLPSVRTSNSASNAPPPALASIESSCRLSVAISPSARPPGSVCRK